MKTSPRLRNFLLAAGSCLLAVSSANAATLLSDYFETNLGNWTGASNARYYKYLVTNQPVSPYDTTNFASTGDGAANLYNSGGTITTTVPLALATGGYSDVTIAFNDRFFNGSTSRRATLSYSDDAGTTWLRLGAWDSGEAGGNLASVLYTGVHSASVTLTPGSGATRTGNWDPAVGFVNQYTGTAFTNNTLFRFTFGGSNASHNVYIDDIVISASLIPEPGAALLGGLGFLLLLRRRR